MKPQRLYLNLPWFMTRLHNIFMIGIVLLAFLTTNTQAAKSNNGADDEKTEAADYGKQIYRNGILPSGKPVTATVQGDVELSGDLVTCKGCHKRSGLGSSESDKRILPITKAELYERIVTGRTKDARLARANPSPRRQYTDKSLKAAIRKGIDPNGRVLDPLMPRFALSDKELDYLIPYIKSLSSQVSPGVSATEMKFATIITEDANPEKAKLMLEVLNQFFVAKNANTRNETGRAKNSPWDKQSEYTGYRIWELIEWHLKGEPDTWQQQLEQLYNKDPVFAVLSGISTKSWHPIHNFCVDKEIPCLFPNTDLPKISDTDFYPVYFTKGLTLQAEILTKYLAETAKKNDVLLQILQKNAWGITPTEIINASKKLNDRIAVHSATLDKNKPINAVDIDNLIKKHNATHVVLWLKDYAINPLLPALKKHANVKQYFLPTSVLGNTYTLKNAKLSKQLRLIYTFEIPKPNYLIRTLAWTKSKKIDPTHTFILANTFFAVKIAIDAVTQARTSLYRDYVLELIEHSTDNMLTTSVYPRVSLAPNQRFVSKGGYIAAYNDTQQLYAVSEWIVP